MHFGHTLTALITPFDSENNVNYEVMTDLIEHLIANGTDGFIVTGTTGEAPVLSQEEIESIYKHAVSVVNGRVPVLAGTGSNDTKKTITITDLATKANVDGIMLVAPYYNRPCQKGLYEHFKTVAESTDKPIMLYNIPSRCSVLMEAETTIKLSEIDNIVATKEASGNLDLISHIIANTPDDFYVYSGDDSMTLPMMSIGATGVVSVASHIIGNEMSQLVKLFQNGQVEEAAKLHGDLLPIMKGLFMAPSPAPVKTALRLKGFDVGSVRLPLVDLTEEEINNLKQIII